MHFPEPGLEHKEDLLTASCACAKGGVTSFLEMPNTRPLTIDQRRLHILHLSTGVEAELLRQDKPSWVTAEVTPQHLLLNSSAYEQIGTLAQMNPPLRTPQDNQILWQALLDGVIDFIATDHPTT